MPRLLVNRDLLQQTPTVNDPLGARSRLFVAHVCDEPDGYRMRFTIDGEQTPELYPHALVAYLCLEYPDLFKVDGVD